MANNVIKLTCMTPDTYRNIIKHSPPPPPPPKKKGIHYNTYQLKEETAHRVVLKYLHHTTEVEDIRQELFALGHVVRNINVHHRLTKEPLNRFFIGLEPATNNKDIYNIMAIQNKIIHIEPPRTNKKHIPQCVRCQQYGHTRTYCNKTYTCVKCGGSHNSKDCNKRRDTPVKCASCGGNHPANYKGCEHYHNIIKGNNPHRTPPQESSIPIPTFAYNHITTPHSHPQQQQQHSYADIASNRTRLTEEPITTLKSFLRRL